MTCKILSREEWAEKTPPFTWMDIRNPVVGHGTMRTWIEEHCGDGWVWFDADDITGKVFLAFESDADYMLFKIWLVCL